MVRSDFGYGNPEVGPALLEAGSRLKQRAAGVIPQDDVDFNETDFEHGRAFRLTIESPPDFDTRFYSIIVAPTDSAYFSRMSNELIVVAQRLTAVEDQTTGSSRSETKKRIALALTPRDGSVEPGLLVATIRTKQTHESKGLNGKLEQADYGLVLGGRDVTDSRVEFIVNSGDALERFIDFAIDSAFQLAPNEAQGAML